MRVLQVLGSLDRGGIETWLSQIMSRGNAQGIHTDFAVYEYREYDFSQQIEEMGGSIFAIGNPRNPVKYISNLRRVIRQNGPYDVVHSHLNETSGIVLLAARLEGVKSRIAHSHTERLPTSPRRLLYSTFRQLSRLNAHEQLACSMEAGQTVFAKGSNWKLLHCGTDLGRIDRATEVSADEIGALRAGSSLVVGHVGRFDHLKNQQFLIDVFDEIVSRVPDARLLFAGKGKEMGAIQRKVQQLGLVNNVVFLGMRSDAPSLMRQVFDVMVFPSIVEGLGIVLMEAQAAGLPIVASDSVMEEAFVFEDLSERISLDQPVEDWADAVIEIAKSENGSPDSRSPRIAEMRGTSFDVDESARSLFATYAQLTGQSLDCTRGN